MKSWGPFVRDAQSLNQYTNWRCSLKTAGNTYWLNNRQSNHSATAQAFPALPGRDLSRALIPSALGWLGLIPSWIMLSMVLLASLAICSTVITRTRAELKASSLQYGRMAAEIDTMRRSNAALQTEIHRISSDPRMIESAARSRLGMVKPDDIVVPIGSVESNANSGMLSFVR